MQLYLTLMKNMELSALFGIFAAMGYAVAALLAKRALADGAGVLRLAFLTNQMFVLVFGLYFLTAPMTADWTDWHQPILCGCLFFLGQIFTYAAIRYGDVSLQTPVMGTKAMFVVLIALCLGTEVVTPRLFVAALGAMIAVALLGFSERLAKGSLFTISLALLSAFFFACSDVMVGSFGSAFGTGPFLLTAMVTNALLSFALIPFFRGRLFSISKSAWRWGLLSAGMMAGQALLLNYTLAQYQNVGTTNVLYSSRGLWSVLLAAPAVWLLSLSQETLSARTRNLRLGGAILMSVTLLFWFS